jgi:hypothetical protein
MLWIAFAPATGPFIPSIFAINPAPSTTALSLVVRLFDSALVALSVATKRSRRPILVQFGFSKVRSPTGNLRKKGVSIFVSVVLNRTRYQIADMLQTK